MPFGGLPGARCASGGRTRCRRLRASRRWIRGGSTRRDDRPPRSARGSPCSTPCTPTSPFPAAIGIVLVRLGGYSIGVAVGGTVEASTTGARPVHGRNRKGGSSSGRFARRRDNQARVALGRGGRRRRPVPAARSPPTLDAVVLGGDAVGARRRCAPTGASPHCWPGPSRGCSTSPSPAAPCSTRPPAGPWPSRSWSGSRAMITAGGRGGAPRPHAPLAATVPLRPRARTIRARPVGQVSRARRSRAAPRPPAPSRP